MALKRGLDQSGRPPTGLSSRPFDIAAVAAAEPTDILSEVPPSKKKKEHVFDEALSDVDALDAAKESPPTPTPTPPPRHAVTFFTPPKTDAASLFKNPASLFRDPENRLAASVFGGVKNNYLASSAKKRSLLKCYLSHPTIQSEMSASKCSIYRKYRCRSYLRWFGK